MATDIVGSLFGVTPESLDMARQQQMREQAMAYAQLTPQQQITYGAALGGQQFGRSIGGLLGAEDPQLQIVRRRQEVSSQIDWTNPKSILQGINVLGKDDPIGARGLAQEFNKLLESQALVAQRTAEKLTPEQRNAYDLTISSGFKPSDPGFNKAYNDNLMKLTLKDGKLPTFGENREATSQEMFQKPYRDLNPNEMRQVNESIKKAEKPPRFGEEAERESLAMFGKAFVDLTQSEQAAVNQAVQKKKKEVYQPGQPVPQKDWMEFEKFVRDDPALKRTKELISVMPSVIETIKGSTENDIAAKAMPAALARLVGETGPLSNKDIARYARTGGLDDRLAQSAAEFFTGRGTRQQKEQAERFASAVFRGALLERQSAYKNEAERLGYDQSPQFAVTMQQLNNQLSKFKQASPAGAPSASGLTASDEALINKYRKPQ